MPRGIPKNGAAGRRLQSRRARATRKSNNSSSHEETPSAIRLGPTKKDPPSDKPESPKATVVDIPKVASPGHKSLGDQAEDILGRYNFFKVRHVLASNDEIPAYLTIGHLKRAATNVLGTVIEKGGPDNIQIASDKYGFEATNLNGDELELRHVTEVISGKTTPF